MITHKKALEHAIALSQYCKEQAGCQNCIFRKHASDHWDCQFDFVQRLDPQEVEGNIAAKKKNHGWI